MSALGLGAASDVCFISIATVSRHSSACQEGRTGRIFNVTNFL